MSASAKVATARNSIHDFLAGPTPAAWLEWALSEQTKLLWDHGNCEKKAAASALSLMVHYPQHQRLVYRMSRLAREELRHFEQVQKIITRRELPYMIVPAARYAARLRKAMRKDEPGRLIDQLIVGAFIEARSCERFECLAPHLDDELGKFYSGLLESEARHYAEYLELAGMMCSDEELEQRVADIRAVEFAAITEPDANFAFHSGPPQTS